VSRYGFDGFEAALAEIPCQIDLIDLAIQEEGTSLPLPATPRAHNQGDRHRPSERVAWHRASPPTAYRHSTSHHLTASPTSHHLTASPTSHHSTVSPTSHHLAVSPTSHHMAASPALHQTIDPAPSERGATRDISPQAYQHRRQHPTYQQSPSTQAATVEAVRMP